MGLSHRATARLAFRVGVDSGLSVPDRTRLRSSGNDGAVSSPGETLPSLFNGIPGYFSPCGAVNRTGASGGTSSAMSSRGDSAQVLTQMANAEVRRQLEERVRASIVGTSVGAEVFHIGSPSDQTGSDFQNVRSRSTHSLSHPTTSPVSFGAIGSPSVAGNVVPAGAVSSPGLMSDVAGSATAGASPVSVQVVHLRVLEEVFQVLRDFL